MKVLSDEGWTVGSLFVSEVVIIEMLRCKSMYWIS